MPLIVGHLAASVGALALAIIGLTGNGFALAIALLAIGLGTGTTTPAMSVSILDSVGHTQSGLASGLLNGARQTGGAIGGALLSALVGGPVTHSGAQSACVLAACALAGMVALSAWGQMRLSRRSARPV